MLGLLAANLLPLFGLLVLGWSGFSVVLAYVLETVVVGVYTALRIWIVAKKRGENAAMVFFFSVHYGGFVGIQTIFVLIGAGDAGELRGGLELTGLLVMVGGFALSHGQSFFVHFLRGKGYERTTQGQEMARPYVRIFVQQFAVIGGFWLMGVGTLGPALVILGLKTIIDVMRHVSEHRKEAQGAPA